MNNIQLYSHQPVGCDCCSQYKGMACDGCHFYFTNPDHREIHQYNFCFQKLETFPVCWGYTSLCYDCFCQCFWALACKEPNKIYKLDRCLREIDCMVVRLPDCSCVRLSGIACWNTCSLAVSGSAGIHQVSKANGSYLTIIEQVAGATQYTAVEVLQGRYMKAYFKMQTNAIAINKEGSNDFVQCCLPEAYSIEDLAYCPTCFHDHCCSLYILVTKRGCYSYVIHCVVCCLDTEGASPCFCCEGSSCPMPNPHSKNCEEGAASLIESIALVETALSHILNAEGEKIQKILSTTDDSCEIMQVNEVVNKTITSITHLEQVLYAKLQTAKELCGKDCPPCCVKDDSEANPCTQNNPF